MKKLIPLTAVALLTATPALAASGSDGDPVAALIIVGVTLGGYFLPAIIAFGRQHQHRVPILLTNLFLGWTLIGWVAALVWSAMPVSNPKLPPPLPFQS